MKLLFTGASGFIGDNIKPLLTKNYTITTVGLDDSDNIKINLAKEVPMLTEKYDIVLHAAGKAHSVPTTEADKQIFFDVNYQGTVNLCIALEKVGLPKSLVFLSTVAVYGCEYGCDITEDHPVNGDTPYAKSKIMAESYLQKWCYRNGIILGILRPSLIVGKNVPGNLGSMIRGIKSGTYLSIAHGQARKSLLIVDDIAHILPLVAKKGGIYNLCDTYQPTFCELEELISSQLGKRRPFSIPYWMAKSMARIGDLFGNYAPINSIKLRKITESLTFSNKKAISELGWKPLDVLTNYKI